MNFQKMKGLLPLLVLLSGASSAQATSADIKCKVGKVTVLATQSCANVWPTADAKFRWPDLRATCDPIDPLCDSADASISKVLSSEDCKELRVLELLSDDHLARVRCERGVKKDEYLINLDSLACYDRNILTYGSAQQAKPEGASHAAGKKVVARAEASMRAMRAAIAEDMKLVQKLVQDSKADTLLARVRVAHQEAGVYASQIQRRMRFDQKCEPTDPNAKLSDNAVRAQRTCRLLAGAHLMGTRLLDEADSAGSPRATPEPAATLKVRLLRRISATDPYRQADALFARMLVFQALRSSNPGLHRSLKLIRMARETGISDLWELHSGFVFGGSRLEENSGGGYDCSDFMASVLSGHSQEKTGRITTHMLKNVARRSLSDPSMPALVGEAKRLASCFVAVDLRAGEVIQPGDFVISNNEALKVGHVAIVKRNLGQDSVLTIEATGGGANTIMSKARPLREPVPQCSLHQESGQNLQQAGEAADQAALGRSPLRPDLYVLRLRVPALPECPLSTDLSEPQAGGDVTVHAASSGISATILQRGSKR